VLVRTVSERRRVKVKNRSKVVDFGRKIDKGNVYHFFNQVTKTTMLGNGGITKYI